MCLAKATQQDSDRAGGVLPGFPNAQVGTGSSLATNLEGGSSCWGSDWSKRILHLQSHFPVTAGSRQEAAI